MREERYFTQGGQLLYSSTYVFRTKCLAFDRIEIYTFVMALQPTRYGYRCHFALVTYCQHYELNVESSSAAGLCDKFD
jgi:hypothetical protein